MSVARAVDWQRETMRYAAPHARLELCASLLRRMPQRRLLDVGCSTAALKGVLPGNYDYYGCDVTNHARAVLKERFLQLDRNVRQSDCAAEQDLGSRVDGSSIDAGRRKPGALSRLAADPLPVKMWQS